MRNNMRVVRSTWWGGGNRVEAATEAIVPIALKRCVEHKRTETLGAYCQAHDNHKSAPAHDVVGFQHVTAHPDITHVGKERHLEASPVQFKPRVPESALIEGLSQLVGWFRGISASPVTDTTYSSHSTHNVRLCKFLCEQVQRCRERIP